MADERRVRIADIAEELGVSTATVSNVIHGKTKKISDATVQRVQELLEERRYIPSMAGILLAQNDSRIIGVVINDHEKYEGHVLEDSFIASSLNYLSGEIEKADCFMMIKITRQWSEIIRFASMWNMEGLVVMGFCGQDYKKLRSFMHIPFVVYDGYCEDAGRICNLSIDDYDGGFQMGSYFRSMGHRRALCIADNDICMDRQRYLGFQDAMKGRDDLFPKEKDVRADFLRIPVAEEERRRFYQEHLQEILGYTAIFAVSDYYAVELLRLFREKGILVPEDISVAGFDDCPISRRVYPGLTTVKQDGKKRAEMAIALLKKLKEGKGEGESYSLPVKLIKRKSVGQIA